jgi:hypothetical protein
MMHCKVMKTLNAIDKINPNFKECAVRFAACSGQDYILQNVEK